MSTSFQIITNDNDMRYQRYLNAVVEYKKYQNAQTINDEYNDDFIILEKIDIEIITKVSSRYNVFTTTFSQYDIRFMMFLQDKYNFNYNTIYMYFKYMYMNKKITTNISPLDKMLITANGCDLFTTKNWSYFTNLIPYTKFNSSPDIGYYVYTFSLYPLSAQPSGHLNFNHFDDVIFNITSNPMTSQTNPYTLIPITREYNILRIMSGLGSLAWL